MGINNIFKIFLPKEVVFYPLFEGSAENLVQISELLNKAMATKDIAERDEVIKAIKELENVGDDFTHKIYDQLNKTFITPFDREDIQELASQMDEVADYVNTAAQRIKLYRPKAINDAHVKIADLILQAAKQINIAIKELKNIKYPEKIKEACIKIDFIENQADDIYHSALSDLFQNEKDTIELIKTKEILSSLETATDQAEDVSDVLKTILIKFA